ncbi:MAG: 2,3-bisphosphoglycerate-independent phosphoglycerate mutase [Leptospiraceae bacterium]|nr:2,3-bisphosphoglycerate-independent phosphoglycerate mutase [Leptospiraceae bacterium]
MPNAAYSLTKTTPAIDGPLMLIIMDGVGLYKGAAEGYDGNALDQAEAPTLKKLLAQCPLKTALKAHGTAVGMPSDDDMGNSEVGHNAMGAGRVFDQGAKLVAGAIASGQLFRGQAWQELIGSADQPGLARKHQSAVHFIGLLSDGNVHSHIDHLLAMIDQCQAAGVQRLYVHPLLDGRDVEKQSALTYVEQLEQKLKSIDPTGSQYAIASGGGRMQITMDRYEADWSMVERGWQTHVLGAGTLYPSTTTAIESLRASVPGIIDQDLPPFVISRPGQPEEPLAPIQDNDIVIFFNFRGDRAIEISRAFTEAQFDKFDRVRFPGVHYAGMMEYDGDLKMPPRFLVEPPAIDRTVSEYLVRNGVHQYALSETQKYGHVTYFWNGNNSEKFDRALEDWQEIPSDRISFDKAPRMKADEITDQLIQALDSGRYRFLRVNYANGDMVGHTGSLDAAVAAVEAVDQGIARLLASGAKQNCTFMITADHGNCDQMYEIDKKTGAAKLDASGQPIPKTSHTLSPVPLLITGGNADRFTIDLTVQNPGLGNLAATILTLLGFAPPPEYLPSVVKPV